MPIKKRDYPDRLTIVVHGWPPEHLDIEPRMVGGARRRRGHLLPVCSHGAPHTRLFFAPGDPALPPGTEITERDEIEFHPELGEQLAHAWETIRDADEVRTELCRIVRRFVICEHTRSQTNQQTYMAEPA